jgi:hypothetical protein
MSSKAARLWQQLLDQLQLISTHNNWSSGLDCDLLMEKVAQLPAAAVTALLQDMQVRNCVIA